jgi:hypothetical protein
MLQLANEGRSERIWGTRLGKIKMNSRDGSCQALHPLTPGVLNENLIIIKSSYDYVLRSVYIAGIKYTTASSGAMFCLPITRFYSQLFLDLLSLRPIETSGLQPRQDMWMSLSVPCLRAVAVQKFPRRPLNDGGAPRCTMRLMSVSRSLKPTPNMIHLLCVTTDHP